MNRTGLEAHPTDIEGVPLHAAKLADLPVRSRFSDRGEIPTGRFFLTGWRRGFFGLFFLGLFLRRGQVLPDFARKRVFPILLANGPLCTPQPCATTGSARGWSASASRY
jgi:hypothetical protein